MSPVKYVKTREGGHKMCFEVDTPSLVIDMDKVRKNIKNMADYARSLQCGLRPHIKTHKIPELARLQLEYGAAGITCAKLTEAEVMADEGISDIFIAYPVIGAKKINRAINLARRIRLIVGIDNEEGALALSEAAQREKATLEVRMEVDVGLKRTGVPCEKAVAFGKWLNGLPGISLTGIYGFRGIVPVGSRTSETGRGKDGKNNNENKNENNRNEDVAKDIDADKNKGDEKCTAAEISGRQEGEILCRIAGELRNEGINIKDVSGGSTPTGKYVAKVKGITEIRPGTYIFNDMMQVKNNTASIDDCAAFVLVTVISSPYDNYVVIDGGSKAFSTDAPLKSPPYFFTGYGSIVAKVNSDPVCQNYASHYLAENRSLMVNDDLVFKAIYEEHGIIESRSGKTGLRPGDKLLIIPNHICPTVNLYNHVYFLEGGGKPREVSVKARGKLY
jgi:D-serine deaminase-like pyridoxal phosphate-dependent protein